MHQQPSLKFCCSIVCGFYTNWNVAKSPCPTYIASSFILFITIVIVNIIITAIIIIIIIIIVVVIISFTLFNLDN